jgi:hypothetical protein
MLPQSNVREPRENRGRLRHCIGLQTPNATGFVSEIGKAGARSGPKSGYRFGCARHDPFGINFSVKRRMRPACLVDARQDSLNAFILRFAGV